MAQPSPGRQAAGGRLRCSARNAGQGRCAPELEQDLARCLWELRHNDMLFDLETDPDLIEQRIYERQALLCRYRYLLHKARRLGLQTVLQRYRAVVGQ